MSLAIAIAGVLVHPGFIELMAKAARGEHVEFAFIPVTAVKYTYTVIPALVMTLVPVVYRALGGSHYPGGDEKLSEADADRADHAAPAGDPADWPAGHLDRQRHFRAGVYDSQLSPAGCRWRSWAGCGRCW